MVDNYFAIGPTGYEVVLPTPTEVTAPDERIGAVLQSLNGTRTVQTFGHKRTWEMTFQYLTAKEVGGLRALHRRTARGPYYMHDPSVINLLPLESSSPTLIGGAGLSAVAATSALAITADEYPDTTNSYTAHIITNLANTLRSPVVPIRRAREYTFSAYVRRYSGTGNITPQIAWWSQLGTSEVSVTNGTPVPVSSLTDFTRISLSVTVPATGWTARVGLLNDQTVSYQVQQLQFERGTVATDWVPGEGTPKVAIDTLDVSYPRHGLYDAKMRVLEL